MISTSVGAVATAAARAAAAYGSVENEVVMEAGGQYPLRIQGVVVASGGDGCGRGRGGGRLRLRAGRSASG